MGNVTSHSSANETLTHAASRHPGMVDPGIMTAFAYCDSRLDAGEYQEAIERLAADLEAVRLSMKASEWRRVTHSARSHPLHARLLQDPYLLSAFSKPRGYPGDADTLDFVYGYRQADAAISDLGRELLKISTSVPIAAAIRARRDHIAESIREVLSRTPDAQIVSIACGHMRELHLVGSEMLKVASIIGIDHDSLTVESLTRLHHHCGVRAFRATVQQIVAGKVTFTEADMIYAAGLYDYLPDPAAAGLTAVLAEKLRAGGLLLIPNLSPENTERGCMEAVWDWWLTYRGPAAMQFLARAAQSHREFETDIYQIANGRVWCLAIRAR